MPLYRRMLMIFALAYFFMALTPPPFHLLNGMGKPWINTLFFALTASLNILLIGVSFLFGISLTGVAWAFTGAIICCVPAYYLVVERVIWRNPGSDTPIPTAAINVQISTNQSPQRV